MTVKRYDQRTRIAQVDNHAARNAENRSGGSEQRDTHSHHKRRR